MNKIFKTILLAGIFIVSMPGTGRSQFVSGSTGVDGPLSITANTTLALPSDGIFNFTTVNVAPGATLTFTRNTGNTPVRILATGDVVIDGTISVNGQPGGNGLIGQAPVSSGRGGPGGFDGGRSGYGGVTRVSGSYGLGPSGGQPDTSGNYPTSDPSHLVLLLGGSGGGGGLSGGASSVAPNGSSSGAGGGGGGAILIASSGTITINGQVSANGGKGGDGIDQSYGGGGGSGGGIRFVANRIAGAGTLSASGGDRGTPSRPGSGYVGGGKGIIRLEALTFSFTGTSTSGYSISTPSAASPLGLPTLKITDIGGQPVPPNTTGSASSIDITLPPSVRNPVSITASATRIPPNTYITFMVKEASGSGYTYSYGPLAGTYENSSLTHTRDFFAGVSIVEAYTNPFTVTASLAPHLPMIGKEPVDRIKVGSILGGEEQIALITKSGREVPARVIAGELVPLFEKENR